MTKAIRTIEQYMLKDEPRVVQFSDLMLSLMMSGIPPEQLCADVMLMIATHSLALEMPREEFLRLCGVAFDDVVKNTARCHVCGCTDRNCAGCIKKTGSPCYWVDANRNLCSACAGPRGAS